MGRRVTAFHKHQRTTAQRRTMLRSLADSLFIEGSIMTTEAKAKDLRKYVERTITAAKKATSRHDTDKVAARLHTAKALHRLQNELLEEWKGRTSGFVRVQPGVTRRGDNARLFEVSLVLEAQDAKPEGDTDEA